MGSRRVAGPRCVGKCRLANPRPCLRDVRNRRPREMRICLLGVGHSCGLWLNCLHRCGVDGDWVTRRIRASGVRSAGSIPWCRSGSHSLRSLRVRIHGRLPRPISVFLG